MPKNVFRKNMDYEPKLTRSSKDLSFDNNFTTKFGQITPLMWKFLNAGESISIDTNFAIQFKPTVFPVQTPIRATMHFFKVPIRLLYKDWEDFRYGNKTDLVLPYHSFIDSSSIKSMFKTGGLMDYLGVPSTYYGDGNFLIYSSRDRECNLAFSHYFLSSTSNFHSSYTVFRDYVNSFNPSSKGALFPAGPAFVSVLGNDSFTMPSRSVFLTRGVKVPRNYLPLVDRIVINGISGFAGGYQFVILSGYKDGLYSYTQLIDTSSNVDASRIADKINAWFSSIPSDYELIIQYGYWSQGGEPTITIASDSWFELYGKVSQGTDWVDLPSARLYLDNLAPSALPARAYEMIYNAFFRSNQNVDPFKIDGVVEPNKYLPTTDGGPDDILYGLHFRNWDDDFLTTAYKTPQQGPAPLVGITSVNANSIGSLNGVMQVDRGDGTTAEIGVKLDENAKVVSLSNDDLAPESAQVRLEAIRAVTQGISINDFRDVDAFQIWLERNIRRGLKFVDQQLAHTGVKIKNRELDMPEFIGGYSRMVQVSKVNDTTSEGLGDYAGQLSLFDGSRHNITTFADQPCIVMGLMTVIPQASYSQLMPKFFSRRTAGDFFDPAFNKIGLQPITYREVCPVQCLVEGTKDIDSTFGYQIPWYDDQSSVDEVHGQMRQLTMRDRLINRTFSLTPELSTDFLRIDPEQVNDVFPDRNPEDDPICGQVHFTMYKKSQIYDMHVPGII